MNLRLHETLTIHGPSTVDRLSTLTGQPTNTLRKSLSRLARAGAVRTERRPGRVNLGIECIYVAVPLDEDVPGSTFTPRYAGEAAGRGLGRLQCERCGKPLRDHRLSAGYCRGRP